MSSAKYAKSEWALGHAAGILPAAGVFALPMEFLKNVGFVVANQSQLGIFAGEMVNAVAADLEIDSAMTLNQVRVGCDVRIRVLSGPGCDRLRDLGFCEQLQVRKLAGGRNLICSVCGTRMAISRELAEQVLVAPLV